MNNLCMHEYSLECKKLVLPLASANLFWFFQKVKMPPSALDGIHLIKEFYTWASPLVPLILYLSLVPLNGEETLSKKYFIPSWTRCLKWRITVKYDINRCTYYYWPWRQPRYQQRYRQLHHINLKLDQTSTILHVIKTRSLECCSFFIISDYLIMITHR